MSATFAGAFGRVRATLARLAEQYEHIGRLQAANMDTSRAEQELASLKLELQDANALLAAVHRAADEA